MAEKQVNLGSHGSFSINEGGLHRALGIAAGKKIPEGRIRGAENSSDPHTRRMAASAEGLKHMNHRAGKPKKTRGYGGPVFQE